jgi:hypothetical protein
MKKVTVASVCFLFLSVFALNDATAFIYKTRLYRDQGGGIYSWVSTTVHGLQGSNWGSHAYYDNSDGCDPESATLMMYYYGAEMAWDGSMNVKKVEGTYKGTPPDQYQWSDYITLDCLDGYGTVYVCDSTYCTVRGNQWSYGASVEDGDGLWGFHDSRTGNYYTIRLEEI